MRSHSRGTAERNRGCGASCGSAQLGIVSGNGGGVCPIGANEGYTIWLWSAPLSLVTLKFLLGTVNYPSGQRYLSLKPATGVGSLEATESWKEMGDSLRLSSDLHRHSMVHLPHTCYVHTHIEY